MQDLDALSIKLASVFLRMQKLLDQRMAAQGASFARTKVLMLIEEEGPLRAADVAILFTLAPRTVTQMVEGLERQQLIRREVDAKDRRVKWIYITELGRQTLESSEPERQTVIKRIFDVLDDAERERFDTSLEKLLGSITAEHEEWLRANGRVLDAPSGDPLL